MQKFKNLSTNIKTLKVELNNYKEIYIIYEKPENNKYINRPKFVVICI